MNKKSKFEAYLCNHTNSFSLFRIMKLRRTRRRNKNLKKPNSIKSTQE